MEEGRFGLGHNCEGFAVAIDLALVVRSNEEVFGFNAIKAGSGLRFCAEFALRQGLRRA